MMSEEIENKILECLKKAYPKDLSIKEVATECGLHRNTASKYLLLLVAKGKLTYRTVGKAKLFTLASRKEDTSTEQEIQKRQRKTLKDFL